MNERLNRTAGGKVENRKYRHRKLDLLVSWRF